MKYENQLLEGNRFIYVRLNWFIILITLINIFLVYGCEVWEKIKMVLHMTFCISIISIRNEKNIKMKKGNVGREGSIELNLKIMWAPLK